MKKMLLISLLTFVNLICAFAQYQNISLSQEIEPTSLKTDLNHKNNFEIGWNQFRPLTLDPTILNGSGLDVGDTLTLNLFNDKIYTSTIISRTVDVNGVVTLVSHFTKYHYAYCFISVSEGKAAISIEIPDLNQFYVSRYQPNGELYLIQIDEQNKGELEGGESLSIPKSNDQPLEKSPKKLQKETPVPNGNKNITSCLGTSDVARINVLIVYTPAASTWSTSNDGGINNTIALAMARCNLASTNNNLGIQFNLAHSAQVSYTEVNASTDLSNLTNGNITNVFTLRDTYASDLIVLFSFESSAGGLGWLLTESTGMVNYGFSLTRVQQASWTYTTIHEIGHNMGAHHHKLQNTQPGPTVWNDWSANSWSAGWRWTGTGNAKYCDLMTYESGTYFSDGVTHSRVGYFSDPLITYQGVTVGHASDGDNSRTLKEVKHFIAQYRDSTTLQYCTAAGGNTLYGISSVQLGTITQNAGTSPYYDFSNCAANVTVGTPIQVIVGITNSFSTQQLLAWVDWNDNKTFDSGEQVYASSIAGATQYTFNITPPIGTTAGLKRLRFRFHITSSGPNSTACGTSTHGEVQDFTLNVIASSCQAVSISSDPVNQNMCNTGGCYLGVGVTGTNPISYQWQYRNGGSWVNVSNSTPTGAAYSGGTSATLGVFTITNPGSYEYRCIVTNCSSLSSDTSISAFVAVYSLPSQPSIISGDTIPCQNTTKWYQLSSDPSATFFSWSFPSDWTILTPTQSIVGWNFDNATKRGTIATHANFIATPYTADSGTVNNINIAPITIKGGAEFSAWTTGATGFAPNSTKWDSGMNLKYWQITCSTKGIDFLKLSSKQRSSSSGPKNFKVQYSLDGNIWLDLAGSVITVADNFTTGVLNNIDLPQNCSNQDSLRLRWIMTSNTAINNGLVGSSGTNRIDDIYLIGKEMTNDSVSVTVGTQNGTITGIPINSCGAGASQSLSVTTITVPAQPSIISGNVTPCQGTTGVTYSVTNVSGVTYTWSLPSGWSITGGQNTNSITVTAGTTSGDISVTPSNTCGNGTTRTLSVSTITVPDQPSTITGNVQPCQGATGLTYSVTNVSGVAYTWSVPTGWNITGGQGSDTITVTAGTTNGDITVTPSNSCGNGTARNLSVSTISVPDQPSTITGNIQPCQGATGLTYSVTNVLGVTYTWTVPTGWSITGGQNTNTITVSAGTTKGDISVTPSNICGNGTARSLAVTTITFPAQPSTISGNVQPCQGATGLTYSVTNVLGVTYTWTVPTGWSITGGQNTNTITVSAGTTNGDISVTPSNSCGNGTARNLSVSTISVPDQPSTITGNIQPCQGTIGLTYSVTNVSGVTYTWTVPTGWSITGGQNTNTITVTAGTNSGDITVTPNNSCGNGTARTLAVTTITVPAQPSTITGNVSPCQGTSGLTYSVTNVSGVTYTWTVPTGWSITGGQNTNSITVTAGTSNGDITVTPSNTCGNGTARTLAVTTITVPVQPSTISGNIQPCQGTTGLTYSVTNVSGVTYTWTVPSGWSINGGQSTNTITVTAGTVNGDISVTPSNTCGNGTARTLAVTTITVPAQPSTISGNVQPCQGTTGLTYSVTNISGVTYTWSVPTGWSITGGQNTNTITVSAGTVNGDISVTPSNTCGNGTARTLAVTTITVPAQPSTITGNIQPCQGTTGVTYSVTNVSGVTYTWSLPSGWSITGGQNTNSITVTAGTTSGDISVTPSNTCGNGTARTLAVSTITEPAQPSTITGNVQPCQGATGLNYSVTNVAGVIYTWTVPSGWSIAGGQGTHSITVTAGTSNGDITVIPSNTCGNGTARSLAVTTITVPAQPSTITGNIQPCQGASGLTYSLTNVSGVLYTWTVPTGWSITGGQGTHSITVTAGTSSGDITVTPNNSCGNGTARNLFVSTITVPDQPSTITGNVQPCQGATETYAINGVAIETYTWSVPSGWSITGGQNTNTITVTAGTTNGDITVTPNNSCGNGTARTLAVTTITVPDQPSTITGNIQPCQGTTGLTYSVTNVAGVTYTWTVPTGWSITGGQNTNTITVTAGTTNGDITVTPSNSCGNGTTRTLSVSTITVPDQPSTITGNVHPCQGTTGLTYSVTNVSGVTYTWTVPTGWSITGGQNTNTITVTAGTTNGDITVTPNNSCGNGTARTLAVTTITVPAQPSTITGNIQPCQGTAGLTYSVTNVSGVTYTWSVPSGWSITGGQSTNSITVTAGTSNGDITVTPSNTCGNGTARTLAVTTITVPDQPSSITGNLQPCQGTTGLTYSVTNVSGVAYTWTVPSGWSITGGQNTNTITVTAGSSGGDITVTPSNSCGNGTARTFAVTTITVPVQPSTISGNVQPCQGTTGLFYSVTNVSGVTYTWTVPTGWSITGGQNSNTITVTAGTTSGDITVTPSNSCGNGTIRTLSVSTLGTIAQPSEITGNIQPCQGTTGLTYSVTNISGVTYTWTVPTGWSITGGQNTNSITVTAGTSNGDITVTPSNSCGNGTSRILSVSSITVPDQPSTISGNVQPCQGTTGLTFSVTNVSGVTYTWTVPTGWSITGGEGTNSITVTAGTSNGDITVTPSNSCGNGSARTLAVTTITVPAQPSTITGNVQPCQGTTGLTYSVTNIAGVTYTWNVPTGWSITGGQNTNSITVTAGTANGDITVTPNNSCGNGTARTLAVTTITVPAQPSTITGNVSPCQGTSGLTYSVTNVSGVTYTWTVPTGWSITGGQNTNSITVTAGTSNGDITVTPSNTCGNGTARTLTVSTITVPDQPSTISGNVEPCQGSTETYAINGVAIETYTWTVPSGWNIISGQGSDTITVTAGTTNGDITVTPSNSCGNGTARSLAVTTITVPAQPSTITGNIQSCQGTAGLTYSVTNVSGVTYTWSLPSGWSITGGQNTNTITVTAGTTNGDISVTPSNTCGNGTARTLAVTTITVPAQPSIISGNVSPCQGTTSFNYSVTNVSGVTYTWTVPTGWSITGGQNTNSITVIADTTNGDISVTPSNSCGNGTARTLAVTTVTVPAQPSAISGNVSPCQGTTGLTYSVTNVSGVTYTWTVPTGWSITGGQNSNTITVTAGTSSGDITVTPSNTCGNGNARTLAVSTITVPTQPSTITGNVQPCQGTTSLTYSVTNVSGVTYTWSVPSGWSITGGQNTNSITVTAGTSSGDITVTPSYSCGNGTARTLSVTTITFPDQPSTITGNVQPCQGTTGLTYSVINVPGVTYTWTVPSGWSIISGQGSDTITVTAGTTNGDITVTPNNSCGNGTARTLAVTTTTVPNQPSTITGNIQPCQGTTGLTYSVTNIAGVTYTWTVPTGWSITGGQGTHSITVTVGTSSGDITVTPSNSCGNGTARSLAVTTITVPAQPSTISGNIQPCQGTTGLTYSVTNISGVTYTWTVPSGWSITGGQNTNSISVTSGTSNGDITVTPSNTCGNGTARTLAVSTTTVPAQPSTISGNVQPCQGVTGLTYSVTNVSGVTYTWTVPSGWSITGGQNTNSITVTAGTTNGDISVTPSNTCGNGTARTLAVTTITVPDQPSTITGNVQPCQGTTELTYSVTNVSGVTYTWTVPTGWSITGGQNTNSITVTAGTTNGDISVTPSNTCGNGTARTFAVTTITVPDQPSTITGNVQPCQGTTGVTYSVTNVSGVTYTWTVPSGWSITGGQNTNSITVIADTTNGDISVTPSNSCGNGTARTLAVTTVTVPAQPSAISGNVSPCQGTTELTYSVTNVSGVTYTWTVPTGWSITGGQGSNTITVTAGTSNGDITVTPSNSCGNGTARTLSVTTIAIPETPVITYNDNYLSSDAPIGNQWYLNNEPILNAINQTHIPVQNGFYFSIVTINDCISDTSNFIIVSNVAIQDFELQSLIHLYPNPTLDEVNFVTTFEGIITYRILNNQGQLILKGEFEKEKSINFDQMARGFYMIQFEINGKTVNKKLIKQ